MEKLEDQKIIDALKTVFDPEIPVDIYELGLIYKCEVSPTNDVLIHMTLTLSLITHLTLPTILRV